MKTLDRKLAAIAAGSYTPDDFIIADAKDADMAFGVPTVGRRRAASPGPNGPSLFRNRAEYLEDMRRVAAQGDIDILLTSASNGEALVAENLLDGTPVTLAVRGNDSTDVWNQRGSSYTRSPSRPFRSADLTAVRTFCDLVLYSVTFNNDIDRDLATLQAYAQFRREAEQLDIRYFLEVFNPNLPQGLTAGDVPAFVNDSIVRMLAGVTAAQRPRFLKVAYNGGDALAELVDHDPSLIVGVLGGSIGTTRDTFELLLRAQTHGARVALFGRKIQHAESQLELVRLMRVVLRGERSPQDAVRAYHEALAAARITPHRELAVDLQLTDPVMTAE